MTAKGTPAVGIYVKHDERVSLWNGETPIHPGDALQLKVVSSGYGYVTVLSPRPDGSLAPLYEAEISPDDETLLPVAWKVDDAPGDKEFIVLLSLRKPTSPPTREAIATGSHANAQLWSTRFVLKKTRGVTP